MKIMGILNVTPDSFSDGGRWVDPGRALEHARQMIAEGADIIDVGAESTRPGSVRIDAEEEWNRLRPVLQRLPGLVQSGLVQPEQSVGRETALISVDTVHAQTARRAIQQGANIINDISGGSFDPDLNRVVADSDSQLVIQHWRGFPGAPTTSEDYPGGVEQVLEETLQQVAAAQKAGVHDSQIIIDPGLGFALSSEYSWEIVGSLGTWTDTNYPVLVGASRKRFIRERFGSNIELGTQEVTRRAQAARVWAVRVHDVANNRQVARGKMPETASARAETTSSAAKLNAERNLRRD